MLRFLPARLQLRLHGLASAPLRERPYVVEVGGQSREVIHSRFNPAWLREAGIDPQVIVELGAFDGGDAHRFKRAYPDARVVTVEADPDRIDVVRETLAGTGVEVHNFAACDTDGPVQWYVSKINGATHGQGSMYQHSEEYRRKFPHVKQADAPIEVPGKRFETFCAEAGIEAIDLLHMDIEGAELSVLRSMGAVRPRLIYLEWRPEPFRGHDGTGSASDLLDRLEYRLVGDLGSDRLYRHAKG